MKYILDFDRTLFDTDLFIQDSSVYNKSELDAPNFLWDTYNPSEYLYADVLPFLSEHNPDDIKILTAFMPKYGKKAELFQKTKLDKSKLGERVSEIIVMEGDKSSFVKEMYDGTPTVFVDDYIEHLQSVKKLCPEVMVVQMMRPGSKEEYSKTHPDIPCVHSLPALADMFEK